MDTLKTIMLAGLGAMSYTYEKAVAMLDDLVKRGDITVNQAKEINEELKKMNEKQKNAGDNPAEQVDELKQEIEQLKQRINELENK
ncbi:MAG: phasin family protein [Xylanivirga thermophila]|jgi:polyhydroxyalkanoate synthesis regulator phasin|uniref:phasin family protein n=1 Tax=Xylanivirga thermophila TaxID=2496273 RepID=UPI00101E16EA|nr:phasin family protein [Xylanivirga thermophila]